MIQINRAFSLLYAIPVIFLFSCGALHTQQTENQVVSFAEVWMNRPFEDFITYFPEVSQPIQLGNGKMRYEFEYDIMNDSEKAWLFLDAMYGHGSPDAYYKIYLFVDAEGTIYDNTLA